MRQAEDFVDILLVLKEQLSIYINSGIVEQDSEEQCFSSNHSLWQWLSGYYKGQALNRFLASRLLSSSISRSTFSW
jgi:hypothetical protein